MSSIDIVVPWVDGGDPEWQKEKAKYIGISGDNREIRFRDWDLMRYWFRGVEKYIPWIRMIHFVTWGHYPSWLNTENPKLNIVRHTDYIPMEYLPTFSSHTIELNLHRIDKLSENFIYSNDDLFILGPIEESYFFKNGIPCDQAAIGPYTVGFRHSIAPIVANNMEIINTRYSRSNVMKEKITNWFNPVYGKQNAFNFAGLMWKYFTGFQFSHYINSFCKSTFSTVWNEEFDVLNQTCLNKVRSPNDVNQWLMRYWQLASNNFIPRKQCGMNFVFTSDSEESISNKILSSSSKILCINDRDEVDDFEHKRNVIQHAFEMKFPDKSSFEL